MTGPQSGAPPGDAEGRRPTGTDPQADNGPDANESTGIVTLTVDEFARHAELFFNFGATYAMMQLAADDSDVRKLAAEVWKTPPFAELQRRRQPSDEPCGVRTCRGCSRCVRADAVKRGAVRT